MIHDTSLLLYTLHHTISQQICGPKLLLLLRNEPVAFMHEFICVAYDLSLLSPRSIRCLSPAVVNMMTDDYYIVFLCILEETSLWLNVIVYSDNFMKRGGSFFWISTSFV
jgi:hypothetical protein